LTQASVEVGNVVDLDIDPGRERGVLGFDRRLCRTTLLDRSATNCA
jgi:hypothetical protein